jgi:hypothetical protein
MSLMAAPAFRVCPFAGAKKNTNNRINKSLIVVVINDVLIC